VAACASATERVARLGEAQRQGRLDGELRRLLWMPLPILDGLGHIHFDLLSGCAPVDSGPAVVRLVAPASAGATSA